MFGKDGKYQTEFLMERIAGPQLKEGFFSKSHDVAFVIHTVSSNIIGYW